jgi:ribosomal peptide maturation radical SAM protein 1
MPTNSFEGLKISMKTILVTMPWGQPTEPAYLMGILHSILEKRGKSDVKSFSYFFDFADYAAEYNFSKNQSFTFTDYQSVIGNHGLGDWVFAVPPFRQNNPKLDDKYHQYLIENGVGERTINFARHIRDLVPSFLNKCLDEIVSEHPDVIVFLPMYRECVPSLTLAQVIKSRIPSIKIVFSGPVCDGPVGAGLIKNFNWIDFVVRDNVEQQLPELIESILTNDTHTNFVKSGLCYRNSENEVIVIEQMPNSITSINNIPAPIYDEYFFRLINSRLESIITKDLWISYRASVGCWWAEKVVCSFCALTGNYKKFISKDSNAVQNDLLYLAHKYQHLKFHLFDWIVDPSYLSNLYHWLGSSDLDLTLYLQTRAHISKSDLVVFKNAGAALQVGVESLSTNILKLMRKGTTAFQNIRLLKWCAELNIKVDWNILYNIPGETAEDYEIIIDSCQSLMHLAPPRVNRFRLHPLSPYFENPQKFSLTIGSPKIWYYYVYNSLSSESLPEIAEEFEFSTTNGTLLDNSNYSEKLKMVVDYWRANSNTNYRQLTYKNGPGFIQIIDNRKDTGKSQYFLEEPEATIYRLCDDGKNIAEIVSQVEAQGWKFSTEDILAFLSDLVTERIMYKENSNYLSLAIRQK